MKIWASGVLKSGDRKRLVPEERFTRATMCRCVLECENIKPLVKTWSMSYPGSAEDYADGKVIIAHIKSCLTCVAVAVAERFDDHED
jgi:hypothetical protein